MKAFGYGRGSISKAAEEAIQIGVTQLGVFPLLLAYKSCVTLICLDGQLRNSLSN